jgi:hypothetical protein
MSTELDLATLYRFRGYLTLLMEDVLSRVQDPTVTPYSKGYIDALVFVLEWVDEKIEELE